MRLGQTRVGGAQNVLFVGIVYLVFSFVLETGKLSYVNAEDSFMKTDLLHVGLALVFSVAVILNSCATILSALENVQLSCFLLNRPAKLIDGTTNEKSTGAHGFVEVVISITFLIIGTGLESNVYMYCLCIVCNRKMTER